MKHIKDYTEPEIKKCLDYSGLFIENCNIEILRNLLSCAIQNGDAPEIEFFNDK